ncbi:sulfotransferase family protein [Alphaproteobacteria bacterium]|nr:sulfotransferase family protein [Alphaproteobacteria bacterium]
MIEIIKKFIPWRRVFKRRVDKPKKSEMIGCLLKTHDLGYMFLPKTASSSLKRLIYEIEMGEPFPNDGLPGRPKFHAHEWVRASRLGDISKAGRRMIIIRDPVKRALSAYADKVQKKRTISKNNLQKKLPELIGKLPAYNPSLSIFLEFSVFCNFLSTQPASLTSKNRPIGRRNGLFQSLMMGL